MSRFIVRVDDLGPQQTGDGETAVDIRTTGPQRNVQVEPDQFVDAFLAEVPPRCRDLVVLAGAIYAADGRVPRGRASDPFDDGWRRRFNFHVGVQDLDFWRREPVAAALSEAVGFVTGDRHAFTFYKAPSPTGPRQPPLPTDFRAQERDANAIILFSGGLDSLAATLMARLAGDRPMLVSHQPAPQIVSRQENLFSLLRQRDTGWAFPRVGLLLHHVGKRPVEFTQRSRSFLFGSLAAVAARHLGVSDIRLCDNGVVTLNLPPSGQCVGTMLSRSTHPGFLRRLQALLRLVTEDASLSVTNSLLRYTKREVVQLIAEAEPRLIQEAVSCAHTEGRTKGQPHCGLCTQCIDRRFATIAAGMQAYDLAERYEKDIFTAPLAVGHDRTHAENYLRFALDMKRFEDRPDDFFVERGADLTDALPEEHAEAFVRDVYDLLQRHQVDVHDVLAKKLTEHASDAVDGTLPEDCVLRMAGGAELRTPPKVLFVRRLVQIFAETLPINFQSSAPANERAMQDAGEAALKAAGERLEREAPQVPFGSVGVRPDFSKFDGDLQNALFVEFKLIKNKTAKNRVHGEIAADLTEYPPACHLLFVVYDPKCALPDPTKLKRDVEGRRENAYVAVVR